VVFFEFLVDIFIKIRILHDLVLYDSDDRVIIGHELYLHERMVLVFRQVDESLFQHDIDKILLQHHIEVVLV